MGLLTGAGISADPPASLPLGNAFRDHLLGCCYAAATLVAPQAVDERGLAVVRAARRTVLGRLEACLDGGSAADILDCFRVEVPNEAHLLAAVHATRGTLHVTLNFDDGIERAYALLAGTAELPDSAPSTFHRALAIWRGVVRPSVPLRVLTGGLDRSDDGNRPLLVKLRASAGLGAGSGDRTPPVIPEIDAEHLTDRQLSAVSAVAEAGHLYLAGLSGIDADCRSALVPRLRPGGFTWTAAALDPDLIDRIRQVDPRQPVLRHALEGMRASLPDAAGFPAWPRLNAGGRAFADRFADWCARVPRRAAAETYAWLLTDTGLVEQARPILQALLSTHDHPRTRWLLDRAGRAPGGECIGQRPEG